MELLVSFSGSCEGEASVTGETLRKWTCQKYRAPSEEWNRHQRGASPREGSCVLRAAELVRPDLSNLLEPRGWCHKPQMMEEELLGFVFTLMDFGLILI